MVLAKEKRMKCAINTLDQTVQFTAETPEDLEFFFEMSPHGNGPWGKGEFLQKPVTELGFDHQDRGRQFMLLGIKHVGYAVRLKLDWMVYAEPKPQAFIDQQNAALRLGHSMIHCFKLAVGDAQNPLDAG
jgi:hypothetical protein